MLVFLCVRLGWAYNELMMIARLAYQLTYESVSTISIGYQESNVFNIAMHKLCRHVTAECISHSTLLRETRRTTTQAS